MSPAPSVGWRLVIHGGAGIIERDRLSAETEREVRAALSHALEAGAAVLASGGGALDAAEAAVKLLEDSPCFNSGRGAVFTYDGTIELDAAIMDGGTRRAGAVAGVTGTRNPIALARAVMEASPHVLLTGAGADTFSREQGLEQAGPDWLATEERRRQLDEMKAHAEEWFDVEMKYGTVGAVALDNHGHVAAATSTGGITGKRWGRVGDSPLVGAGTYADNRSCAVSATGSGEYFIRVAAAHEIGARMRMLGETAETAAARVIEEIGALGGTGGVIFASPAGEAGWSFNAAGMYRGMASPDELTVAIFGD